MSEFPDRWWPANWPAPEAIYADTTASIADITEAGRMLVQAGITDLDWWDLNRQAHEWNATWTAVVGLLVVMRNAWAVPGRG